MDVDSIPDKNHQDFHQNHQNTTIKLLDDIAFDSLSQYTNSPRQSHEKNEKSWHEVSSENSTEPDNFISFMSLKSIKSKEEIQIESKQNQSILLNLNSNIDDLFKKISSLTEQITTSLQPKQFKGRFPPVEERLQDFEFSSEVIQKQKAKSTSLNPYKPLFNPEGPKIEYKPIFFQLDKQQAREFTISMKLFQTGKSLGCGKFGEVVQCKNLKTNNLYALKKIFKSVIDQYNMEDQVLTELKILSQIDHPNIVKAYQAFTDDFHIFILMEYVHGPLLLQKLRKSSQIECKKIIRQVLQAISYLHNNKISHRDIKPENIMLSMNNVVKICDFGWAAQGEEKMKILCGTLDYISPEMAKEEIYTEKIDLWNIGVLTYELIYGYPPFKASTKSRIFEKVKNLQYSFPDQISISEQCKSFISGYLRNQYSRQSIEWGLNHKFLQISQEELCQQNQFKNFSSQIDQILDWHIQP